MSQENVRVVLQAMASFRRTGDVDPRLFAPNVELINAPGSPFQNAPGPQGLRDWAREVSDAFEEWEMRPSDVRDAPPDKVLVLNRAWGRGRETGLEVEMDLHLVYTVTDGKISRIQGYLTREEALEAARLRE